MRCPRSLFHFLKDGWRLSEKPMDEAPGWVHTNTLFVWPWRMCWLNQWPRLLLLWSWVIRLSSHAWLALLSMIITALWIIYWRSCKTTSDYRSQIGPWVWWQSQDLSDGNQLTIAALDEIMHCREFILRALFTLLDTCVNAYCNLKANEGNKAAASLSYIPCSYAEINGSCKETMVGSLLIGAPRAGLWPQGS